MSATSTLRSPPSPIDLTRESPIRSRRRRRRTVSPSHGVPNARRRTPPIEVVVIDSDEEHDTITSSTTTTTTTTTGSNNNRLSSAFYDLTGLQQQPVVSIIEETTTSTNNIYGSDNNRDEPGVSSNNNTTSNRSSSRMSVGLPSPFNIFGYGRTASSGAPVRSSSRSNQNSRLSGFLGAIIGTTRSAFHPYPTQSSVTYHRSEIVFQPVNNNSANTNSMRQDFPFSPLNNSYAPESTGYTYPNNHNMSTTTMDTNTTNNGIDNNDNDIQILPTPPPNKNDPKPPLHGHTINITESTRLICVDCDHLLGEGLWTLNCSHVICVGCAPNYLSGTKKTCPSCRGRVKKNCMLQLYV